MLFLNYKVINLSLEYLLKYNNIDYIFITYIKSSILSDLIYIVTGCFK